MTLQGHCDKMRLTKTLQGQCAKRRLYVCVYVYILYLYTPGFFLLAIKFSRKQDSCP